MIPLMIKTVASCVDCRFNPSPSSLALSLSLPPLSAAEGEPEHGAARVVPRVQPEVGAGGHGGGLPGGLRRRVARRAAARGQHGRRQRQHGAALQRLALQLPGGAEAPGRR